jgi:cell division protein FtsN
MKPQRGAFVLGMVVGLLIGLALALGVALYITKAPVPFVNKVPGRTAEQDKAEAEKNRNWDPNAPLSGGKAVRPAASAPVAAASAPAVAAPKPGATASAPRLPGRDPAAILSGATPPAAVPAPAPASAPRSTAGVGDPFVYFVQAGAFTRNDEAEQQRARLAMLGHAAKITEREQAGRTVYRVRLGPYPTRDQADALQTKLQDGGIESQLVRVEKN